MIYLFSRVYNNSRILPFFFRHYDTFVDKYFILDHSSTDNTVELLQQNPKVNIFHQENTGLRESELLDFKNNFYKEHKDCNWCIVADVDEFIYYPNILEKLKEYDKQNITVIKTIGFQMYADLFPEDNGMQLYNLVTKGYPDNLYSKCAIFKPGININYHEGSHYCSPSGYVKYSQPEIKLLHYKVFGESFITEMMERNERIVPEDKKRKLMVYSLDEDYPFNPKKIVENLKQNAYEVL